MQSQPDVIVPNDSLELRGEHLLEKLRLAMSNSTSNKGTQYTASTSKCSERSSFTRQTRQILPKKKGEVAAVAAVPSPLSSSRVVSTCPTSPTASTRTLSSDDLSYHHRDASQGPQLLPQPPPPQPTASNSCELEPLDFRKGNILHSSSLLELDILLDDNGYTRNENENTDARTTKNIEFPPKSQEQAGLQDRLRQLGQSQMQQFLLMQQVDKQQAMILQQQQARHQRQRLPTDGIYSFKDVKTNSHQTSVQTTSSHQYFENPVNSPSEGKRPNVISHPINSNTLVKKNSNKRPRAASSPCSGRGSIQGSNSRVRLDLGQANSSPREPRVTVKRNKKTKDSTFQYVKVVGGGIKGGVDKPLVCVEPAAPPKSKSTVELSSLQDYLDSTLESRGYVTSKSSASELGYIKTPTPLQIASFATAVCSANKPGDVDRLRSILQSGLSANPMNKFGDSPFFIACKRGVTEVVKVFIDCGAEVRIADSFGRTPLHHVAWANPPNFDTAKIILTEYPRLLHVMDNHGKTPLDFVAKCHSSEWIKFIDSMTESLWPANADGKKYHPEPSKGAIPDPPNALSIKLAEDVASGRTQPEEAAKLLPSEMSS